MIFVFVAKQIMNNITTFLCCIILCAILVYSIYTYVSKLLCKYLPFLPNCWVSKVFAGLGVGHMIDKPCSVSEQLNGSITRKFQNKTTRCVHFGVDEAVYKTSGTVNNVYTEPPPKKYTTWEEGKPCVAYTENGKFDSNVCRNDGNSWFFKKSDKGVIFTRKDEREPQTFTVSEGEPCGAYTKDGKYDMNVCKYQTYNGQGASHACSNAKIQVCIPPHGHVRVKGTTHMFFKKLRTGRLDYSILKNYTKNDGYLRAVHRSQDNDGSFHVTEPEQDDDADDTYKCWGTNCMPGGRDFLKFVDTESNFDKRVIYFFKFLPEKYRNIAFISFVAVLVFSIVLLMFLIFSDTEVNNNKVNNRSNSNNRCNNRRNNRSNNRSNNKKYNN